MQPDAPHDLAQLELHDAAAERPDRRLCEGRPDRGEVAERRERKGLTLDGVALKSDEEITGTGILSIEQIDRPLRRVGDGHVSQGRGVEPDRIGGGGQIVEPIAAIRTGDRARLSEVEHAVGDHVEKHREPGKRLPRLTLWLPENGAANRAR